MKTKLFCLVMVLSLLLAGTAMAAPYQQHLANAVTFETLEEAHANGPAELEALTGRAYIADPALDNYPRRYDLCVPFCRDLHQPERCVPHEHQHFGVCRQSICG